MRIVVTGSTGFIGTNLISYLKSTTNYKLICLSRNKKDVHYTDYSVNSLKNILKEDDVVIHLAASRETSNSFGPYLDNVIVTDNLIVAAKEKKVQKVIYASSISVYSGQNLIPWTENLSIEPVNYYGLSKFIAEDVIRIGLEQTGIQFYNLRLAHVFGANEKNNYMINLFIRKSYLKKGLVIYNYDENRREMVYVKNVVFAISNCIADKELRSSGVTLNIGSGEALTNYEMANEISKIFDTKKPIIESMNDNPLKKHSLMDGALSKKLGLYSPRYNFEEAVKDIKKIMEDMNIDVPELY
jgi:UDP-glucose 4-epimerase